MARLPSVAPQEPERLSAFAEDWFGESDVRDALAGGMRGDDVADHLSGLAGARYRDALHRQLHIRPRATRRDDVLKIRPDVAQPGNDEMQAHRDWLFTDRCLFSDRGAFLAAISGW